MKPGHGDEAPIIGHFQRMKEVSDSLPDEVKACRKLEMVAMIQGLKERLGDRLSVNPTGQRAVLKSLGDHLEREKDRSQEPRENQDL